MRVVEFKSNEDCEVGARSILVGSVELILNDWSILIGSDLFLALDRSTQPHVLKHRGKPVHHLHCKVHVLVTVEEAVVIVPQVIQELAGVSIDDRIEALRLINPVGHQLQTLIVLSIGNPDDE